MDLLKRIDALRACDDLAYVHNDQRLTYRELNHKANILAQYLQDELKDDRTPIPVYGHKDQLMLICFLACVKSGRAYCPIDTGVPLSRVKAILDAVGSKIVLSCEELALEDSSIRRQSEIETILAHAQKEIDPQHYVHFDDVYYIIFTSGSTGVPKGVQITYANLNHFLDWSLGLSEAKKKTKVFLNQAPFSFDLSVMDVYTALASGGTIFALDKAIMSDYSRLFAALQASNTNVWVSTPSFADMCLIDKSFSQALLPSLDTFVFCGEILTNETARKLQERFPSARIINTYGPTEATVAVTDILIDETIVKNCNPLPIGKAKPGTMIKIMNEEGEILPEGEKGEIIILGDTVGKGYFRDSKTSAKAFFQMICDDQMVNAYHSGDKGYIKDGCLYYCGRIDLQIKLNGYRIEIADIEQNLMRIDHVENAVIVPQYKDDKIKHLIAYVIYDGDTSKRFQVGQELSTHLKEYVPTYMIPKKYIFVKELPMTNNGKVDRQALQGAFT